MLNLKHKEMASLRLSLFFTYSVITQNKRISTQAGFLTQASSFFLPSQMISGIPGKTPLIQRRYRTGFSPVSLLCRHCYASHLYFWFNCMPSIQL